MAKVRNTTEPLTDFCVLFDGRNAVIAVGADAVTAPGSRGIRRRHQTGSLTRGENVSRPELLLLAAVLNPFLSVTVAAAK
jgi:hypothetical protein